MSTKDDTDYDAAWDYESAFDNLRIERDALRAENERLRDQLAYSVADVKDLTADNERLNHEVKAWEQRALMQLAESTKLEEQANHMAGTLAVCTEELLRLRADQRLLDESVRNQAIREAIHKEELKRLRACLKHIGEVAESTAMGREQVDHWWYGEEVHRALSATTVTSITTPVLGVTDEKTDDPSVAL